MRSPALDRPDHCRGLVRSLPAPGSLGAFHRLHYRRLCSNGQNLSGHNSFSTQWQMVRCFPLYSRAFSATMRLILSIHILTWKLQASVLLIHSIHASTFTPLTPIVATKGRTAASPAISSQGLSHSARMAGSSSPGLSSFADLFASNLHHFSEQKHRNPTHSKSTGNTLPQSKDASRNSSQRELVHSAAGSGSLQMAISWPAGLLRRKLPRPHLGGGA